TCQRAGDPSPAIPLAVEGHTLLVAGAAPIGVSHGERQRPELQEQGGGARGVAQRTVNRQAFFSESESSCVAAGMQRRLQPDSQRLRDALSFSDLPEAAQALLAGGLRPP